MVLVTDTNKQLTRHINSIKSNRSFPSCLVPLFQSESNCENDFDLHENEPQCGTHFHIKGFLPRLVLKQRHKRTRKWPVGQRISQFTNANASISASTRKRGNFDPFACAYACIRAVFIVK